MLMNKCITLVMVIASVNIVALATTGIYTFTQNSCSAYLVCAQSDLSLPIPSENDIEASGSVLRSGDQLRETDKDPPGSVHGYADNGDNSDVNAFLLPFP